LSKVELFSSSTESSSFSRVTSFSRFCTEVSDCFSCVRVVSFSSCVASTFFCSSALVVNWSWCQWIGCCNSISTASLMNVFFSSVLFRR
jgi:hypothetical protein